MTIYGSLVFGLISLVLAARLCATSILVDDFTKGAFSLRQDGATLDTDTLSGNFINQRRVNVTGGGVYTCTSVLGSGEMNYTVTRPDFPSGVSLSLIYAKDDFSAINLLGMDAFVIKVTGIVGECDVTAFLQRGAIGSVPVLVSRPGDFRFSFANTGNTSPLNALNEISFRIVPRSVNLSLTLGQIAIVPEPSSSVCLALAGVAFLRHRSRR
jgi:hypothetical protein